MYLDKPPISISPTSSNFYDEILKNPISIFCGRNNSGKSFILKKLYKDCGDKTSFLGPNRYQNFQYLSLVADKRNKSQEYFDWMRNLDAYQQNIDNSPWNLQQAIAELGNSKRETLFKMMNLLLNSEISIRNLDPDNEMSQKFISVDGYNISYTSAGFRLIASILTSLLDEDYSNFLIDEPELGISPEVQGLLADFLRQEENRKKYFPHLEKLVIATHSPIFIDRKYITNNYYIEKNGYEITINKVEKLQDINSLQFFLLGNRFETLFLPSIIILVEGKCDYKYILQLVKKKFKSSNISVIQCNGDNRIKEYINMATMMFGDLRKSPYQDRIIAILDKVHQSGLKQDLISQGLKEENIVVWDKNGIEYYYPGEILIQIFGAFDELHIASDVVSANGVSKKKNELVEEVIARYTGSESLNPEIETKFMALIMRMVY